MREDVNTKMKRLQLWFFRDLNDEQRLSLFAINGFPVSEIRTQHEQLRAFHFLFNPGTSSS